MTDKPQPSPEQVEKPSIQPEGRKERAELAYEVVETQTQESLTDLKGDIERQRIEKELKVEDLRELPVSQLLQMERERPGVLLFAFTTWGDRHSDVNVENFNLYNNPTEGTEIQIDFRNNEEAYWKIGAADMIPPQVRKITLRPKDGGERTSTRRTGLSSGHKSGFFDEAGYMSVFTGDTVIIGGVDTSYKEKYFDAEKRAWDEEKYAKDHGDEDDTFLVEAWKAETGVDHPGPVLSDEEALRLRSKRSGRIEAGNIRDVLASPERHEWHNYTESAASFYKEKFGLAQVEPAVILAIIKYESGFKAQIPNQQGSSALGLGQFIPDTWMSFLRENPTLPITAETQKSLDGARTRAQKLALRTNPELAIYATTWYTAQNAKALGLSEVITDNAPLLYLAHHDGLEGARRMIKYKQYRDGSYGGPPLNEADATAKAKLSKWQKAAEVYNPRKGKLEYKPPYNYADEHWDLIVGRFGEGIARTAEAYRSQLEQEPGQSVA